MSQSVYKPKSNAVERLFGRRKAVIGVVHSLPLPGAPNYDGDPVDRIYDYALAEARRYRDGGVDALIVENHGDIPFAKPEDLGPETAAAMAVMTDRVRREIGLPVGVNVLANGAVQALAVAKAAGACFVRVNQWCNAYVANEGFMEGRAGEAARYRAMLGARDVAVFADVHVKHGAHAITADRSLTELTRDAQFFDADAVIVTGQRTGDSADLGDIETARGAGSLPVVVGSGVHAGNVGAILRVADAVIVASSLKHDGGWWNEVDPARLTAFMAAVAAARGVSRVFVLGNATLDCIQRAQHLPRPGETVLGDVPLRCAGGKGLNQAVASARAGAGTVLVAPVGADPEAEVLKAGVAGEDGLAARWIASAAPTDYSSIWVAADGENAILSSAAAARGLGEGEALVALADLAAADLLVLQGNLGRDVTAAAARFARARGGRTLLNTAPVAWDMTPVLDAFDIVVANAGEALTLTGKADAARAAAALGAARIAVVTRGAAGAVLARGGRLDAVAAPAVRAVDTAGAGDVLTGVLAAGLARGRPVARALALAVAAASIAVTRHGTLPSFPSRREIAALDV